MQRDKVAEHDGKARCAPTISEAHTFIHPEYEIAREGGQIGPTGPLVIARLRPKGTTKGILPTFVFRWDEKANDLNVDAVNVSKAKTRLFKKGTTNYYGHSTVKLASGPRVFGSDIAWAGEIIYRGQIKFNLARKVKTEVAIALSTSVKAET